MAGDVYKAYASSVTTPIDQKRRKEVLLAPELTTYTLWYHYGDLDQTPVRGVTYLATLSDGETRQGSLDATGQARLTNVVKGPVTVSYQHDASSEDDDAIRQAREEVKRALDAIVVQTRQDMAAEWVEWNEAGWLKRQYLLTANNIQGQAVGAWKWLSGTVESIWQLAVLLYKTDREIRELRWLIITGQWEQLDRKIADYRGKGEQVLAAASETKELLILIFHDEATRKIITDFPAQWWAAIPPDEQAQLKSELGTEIAIDVIIAVLIAAFTAGAGSAMYGSAKWSQRIGKLGARVVELLDKLEEAFRKLAKALKIRKRRILDAGKSANAERIVEPHIDMSADVALINAGEGTRNGNLFTVNGRTYELVNGDHLVPNSGPGFHTLSRGEFDALGVFNKFGDTPQARAIAEKVAGPQGATRALDVWRLGQ